MNGGEVTTYNQFESLVEESRQGIPSRKKNEEEESFETSEGESKEARGSKNILQPSYYEFMESKGILDFENNKDLNFMYNNKLNSCSGYFLDFITLNDDLHYDNPENFYNFVNDFNFPNLKNGKCLRQLSDYNSRYDGKYFRDMNLAYKISRKFRSDLEALGETKRSIPKVQDMGYGAGSLGETKISIPRIKAPRGGNEAGDDVVLSGNLITCRRSRSQTVGVTRKSIPTDLREKEGPQTLGGTGISIPRNQDRGEQNRNSRIRIGRNNGGGLNMSIRIINH